MMKSLKATLLLLFVLCFGLDYSAQGQPQDPKLQRRQTSLKKVKNTADDPKQTTDLAKAVREFFKRRNLNEVDFNSPDFENFLNQLIQERDKVPVERRGELVSAVNALETNYRAYNTIGTGDSGENVGA